MVVRAGGGVCDLIKGRSEANCHHFDAVRTAAATGLSVSRFVCGTAQNPICPVRASCEYWEQFTGRPSESGQPNSYTIRPS